MITIDQFRKHAHEFADWIYEYYKNIEKYPVKSQVKPGEIIKKLPEEAPETGESLVDVMRDFEAIVMPGITHWQSPNFFAYFPADSSYPSVLGEMLTAALGVQGMKWETSPSATELEERVLDWLKKMMNLPESWHGVIQDTASTSTLAAVLTAREKATSFTSNIKGLQGMPVLRAYCSEHAHSSVDKAIKIAGFGTQNLVKIPVDDSFAMIPGELEKAIQEDIKNGFVPAIVVASIGTTSTTAIDPVDDISLVCQKFNTWLHADAAYAGSALILPEFRNQVTGLEGADSFVFNPHKWLFTNFDCSVFYIRNKEEVLNTFQLIPEYLKTGVDEEVNNYSDWGIQLGRRFRSLKLWFVIRSFGANGLRDRIRHHISLGKMFESWVTEDSDFEILAPRSLNLVCFRFFHENMDEKMLDEINREILEQVNRSGRMYITHTRLDGKYVLRFVASQTYVEQKHVELAWKQIVQTKNQVLIKVKSK